ncbi:extracellular solute-binding protein family 1 [Beutenbergia cavernae DSM 12333]|uniref:Extracellular solute-binding protein family 1 n=1 Tax=Beutenbergia cavernae (strain ATCC BAA-8 / DSM 12333 / CCUG 43141 / JCM 11478 / NBRC 16432 / NCIMB 13614 / HKI 0122) TaxID=471853 RepID=C5C5L9_BEUC1|nr:extracellular solute-binding protein [Beutenbergia cavernae]ACQ80210.1 extracellular solute-binding protein family 1 [Beutenbergia cavernae DSM 12333]
MSRSARRGSAVGIALAAGALALAACGGGSGFDEGTGEDTGGDEATGGAELDVLIGSSGDAETQAVTAALEAWSTETGNTATLQAAADLPQELSQGFAAGSPPDLFYLSTDSFPAYAANGSLAPYAAGLPNADDFYVTLRDSFSFDGELVCAPKDFSTLALIINTDAWEAAGLTDDDVPTTWDELAAVAQTLTTDAQVGLSFGPEWQRIGSFMAQAGGGLVDADGQPIANSAENVEALTYVQGLLSSGSAAYPADIGAGWGGEALGTGAAAMVIEGNWVIGAMTNDFPDIPYRVVELPAGPAGPGTLQFTNCWGVPAGGDSEAALSLVEYLTSGEQQMVFAEAFGVMPSVESVAGDWAAQFPEQEPFIAGAEYAQGVPPIEGIVDVLADFNAQLESLASGDPTAILDSVQANLEAIAGTS